VREEHPLPAVPNRIVVTGGAGYIGSHTVLELLKCGAEVCVIDNFSNSSPEALKRVETLAGRGFQVEDIDIRNVNPLTALIDQFQPDAVIHFAGLKAVGESVASPLRYYENNVSGSINLLSAMEAANCNRIIFSSSATVYGEAQYLPLDEVHPISPTNPYGQTKAMVENIISDWVVSSAERAGISLRYFNPVGAHGSGMIGEDPLGIPNNLVPYVAQVALGVLDEVQVFGNDFGTRDGTGERDYIHVEDLATGHLSALYYLLDHQGYDAINLGTGHGSTVLEVITAYEEACGHKIAKRIVDRREGDTASSLADPRKAETVLGWKATKLLADGCRSSWLWQTNNPAGYQRVVSIDEVL